MSRIEIQRSAATPENGVNIAAPTSTSHARRRRGAMYLLVLATAMIVFAIGASALLAARVQGRAGAMDSDFGRARAGAESAINLGMRMMVNQPSWRTAQPQGLWFGATPFDGGALGLYVNDPVDDDLDDSVYDPILLTGVCDRDSARYFLQVTMQAYDEPLAALSTGIHAGGPAHVRAFTTLTVNGAPLSSNGDVSSLGVLNGSAEAGGSATALVVSGTLRSGVAQKPVPTGAEILALYAPLATDISYNATIEEAVIGRAHNGHGNNNRHGVYRVTTSNNNIAFKDVRVFGTLLVNAGTGTVTIDRRMLMSPWQPGRPTLIVIGNARIDLRSTSEQLSESSADTNFNPVGVPYLGATDNSKDDSYPNEIQGLVYVSGNLELTGQSVIRGSVLVGGQFYAGTVLLGGTPTVHYNADLTLEPPLGFTSVGQPKVVPGSWKRVLGPPTFTATAAIAPLPVATSNSGTSQSGSNSLSSFLNGLRSNN